jgi:hypothetical protein
MRLIKKLKKNSMKNLSKNVLDSYEITWAKPGESVPLMQGMALNRLLKEYPTKTPGKQGWFLAAIQENQAEDFPFENGKMYYLIERLTRLTDGVVARCLIAFQENGDSIEGYAIIH